MSLSGIYLYLSNLQELKEEHPLQQPGDLSRLIHLKGTKSGQESLQILPKMHLR